MKYFGKFPVQEFLELTDEQQTKFWAERAPTSQDLERVIINNFLKLRVQRDETRQGGTYLPLSVWKKMGFDIEKIKKFSKPADIEDHEVLGQTYRFSLEM